MLKKENRKDRTFIKKTELDGAKSIEVRLPWQRLPFYCCALTFTPFEDAVCTEEDGSVFDFMHIIPYIRKYGMHPVSGVPLRQEDLVPLTFHKNSKGDYHCPVLNMVFTEFTHIVAIKTTGNVFSYEAVEELNLKTNNWKELLTNEPFKRKDIIIIQNPNTIDDKAVVDFDHVKKNLKVEDEEYMKKGDLKKLLKELIAKKGRKFALHVGGGGSKAQNGSAAARATILAAREPIKHKSKPASEVKPRQPAFSIVDASVHGRSAAAAAAKAASSDKIAADRTPVNAKMVGLYNSNSLYNI